MGKLSELWAQLKIAKDKSEKDNIKRKINDIEQWCINNKFGGFTKVTDWSKPQKKKGGSWEPFGFKPPEFVSCGNFIKHHSEFCDRCGLDLLGLCLYKGQMLWK